MPSHPRRASISILSVGLLLSCSDGGGPTESVTEDVTVTIRVERTDKLAEKAALGADRGKAKVVDAGTGATLGTATVSIDTTATVWTIPVTLPVEYANSTAVPTIELINLSSRPVWSGKGKEFEPGQGDPPPVEVFPGPPENLAVTGVTITSDAATTLEGDSVALAATVTGGGEGTAVVWSSLDETVATVHAESGMVRGELPGVTAVEAAAGQHADTLQVTVEARVAAIEISPASDTLGVIGDTLRLSARALDARDAEIDGVTFAWNSSDEAVATVDGSGLVTARAFGAARISASAEGVEGAADLTVEEPELPEGVTRRWLGGAADDPTAWGVADNWYPSGVPTEADTVLVGGEATNQPVVSGTYTTGGLIVEEGAEVDTSLGLLVTTGSVDIDGTIDTNPGVGGIEMRGHGVTLAGAVPTLRLDSATVTLAGDATAGLLTLARYSDSLTVGPHSLRVSDILTSYGAVVIDDSLSVVSVAGDLRTPSNGRIEATSGRLEVGGNLGVNSYEGSGDHVTVFNGTAPQSIAGPANLQEVVVVNTSDSVSVPALSVMTVRGSLEISTPVRVAGSGEIVVQGDVSSVAGSELAPETLELGGSAGTELIEGTLAPGVLVMSGADQTITVGPNTSYTRIVTADTAVRTTIAGPVSLAGNLEVAGDTLVLGGDTQIGGSLYVSSWVVVGPRTVSVQGHLSSTGTLVIDDPDSRVVVGGTVSPGSQGILASAGRLEVAGDFDTRFTQFQASGSHVTVFGGDAPQEIRVSAETGFRNLELRNTDTGTGVTFSTSVAVSGSLSQISGIWNVATSTTTTIQGDLILESGVTLNNDGTVEYGGIFTDNGATINGNAPGPIVP